FGAIIAYSLRKGEEARTWFRPPGLIALAVFGLAIFASVIFSENIYVSLVHLLFVTACMGAYFLTANVAHDAKSATMLIAGIVISALGICAFGIRDYAIGTGGGAAFWAVVMGSGDQMRLAATFINPNFLAGFLALALPISLGMYLVSCKFSMKLLFGVAFVIEILALLFTGSKFGIVAVAAAMLVFLLLAMISQAFNREQAVRLVIITVIIAPMLLVFSGSVRSRVEEAKSKGTQAHSILFRRDTWKATARMIEKNPLVGVGAGAFSTAYPRYTIAGSTTHAHQGYLQTGAESGIIAMIAMIVGMLAIGWAGARGIIRRNELNQRPEIDIWQEIIPTESWRLINCALAGAFAGCMVRNLVDSDWFVMGIALPFWMVAGVLVSRTGAASQPLKLPAWMRTAAMVKCSIAIILSISFGLGDWFAPQDMFMQPNVSPSDALHKYELAASVSPWNAVYHYELGKYLVADGQTERGISQLDMAIRLSPKDGAVYFWRGMVAKRAGEYQKAVGFFNQSLKFSPHSTQNLSELAGTYKDAGQTQAYESTLRRMLAIENTPYEKIKGVPEMVDTRYARAHFYFGEKYQAERNYGEALAEFKAAIDRLEEWRSYLNTNYGKVARLTGKLSARQETELLDMLRQSYYGSSEAYAKLGDKSRADQMRTKGEKI
ncbi:MAG: O-antigen ligase family protein, partial [Armatimonadetes bacterium]|nr:O-antigen ligase family protein [Armatimonadota bacterium]